jgi:protoporphyrinogen oxidase
LTRHGDLPVLIVGGGLAGLCASYRLGRRPHRLVEAEDSAGGLCRSVRHDGFTYDYTGHLLHIRRPEIRELVLALLDESAFLRIDRRSGIYSHRTLTEYPFQVNTHGLPKAVVRECVTGFAQTLQGSIPLGEDPGFREWALATFGEGICRHFLLPYNRKLFCTDLDSMTADWVSWSIPKPSWAEVVRGALGLSTKAFGYNASFLYPALGGIDHLPKAFLAHIPPPSLSTAVTRVHAASREAELSTGENFHYSHMISTMPLPRLLASIADAPRELVDGAVRLRYVSVLNLNLGFDAPSPIPHHWIYFPEPEFPFYRVGIYSNLCPRSVPEGCSGFYVEIAHPPGERIDAEAATRQSVTLLKQSGLVPETARLRSVQPFEIACAYVVHDRHRRSFLPEAKRHLERHGILSVGRYGAWEYSAMEDALWHGHTAADRTAE